MLKSKKIAILPITKQQACGICTGIQYRRPTLAGGFCIRRLHLDPIP